MREQTTTDTQVAAIAKAMGWDELPKGTVLTITSPKQQVGRPCVCGCGTKTGGGFWAPGHDAKHKSALYALVRSGDADLREAALAELTQRGWPTPSDTRTQVLTPAAANLTK